MITLRHQKNHQSRQHICWLVDVDLRLDESYQVYLRDTDTINELHNAAFKKSAKSAVELIRLNNSIDSDQLLGDDIPETGEYDQGDQPIGCSWKIIFFFCSAQSAFATGWRVQDHKTVSSGFFLPVLVPSLKAHLATTDCPAAWQYWQTPVFH